MSMKWPFGSPVRTPSGDTMARSATGPASFYPTPERKIAVQDLEDDFGPIVGRGVQAGDSARARAVQGTGNARVDPPANTPDHATTLLEEVHLVRLTLEGIARLLTLAHPEAAEQLVQEYADDPRPGLGGTGDRVQGTGDPPLSDPSELPVDQAGPSPDLLTWAELAREALGERGADDEAVVQWLVDNAPIEVRRELGKG